MKKASRSRDRIKFESDLAAGNFLDRRQRRKPQLLLERIRELEDADENDLCEFGLSLNDVAGPSPLESFSRVPTWLQHTSAVVSYLEKRAAADVMAEDAKSEDEVELVEDGADGDSAPPPPLDLRDFSKSGSHWYVHLLDLQFSDGKWRFVCSLGNCHAVVLKGGFRSGGCENIHRFNILSHFQNNHINDKW
jgi:hypothetical protein